MFCVQVNCSIAEVNAIGHVSLSPELPVPLRDRV